MKITELLYIYVHVLKWSTDSDTNLTVAVDITGADR